ncbi:hypothetical protein PIROE2DRAFT_7157 [Piromyces sp. E2]|nr:hypothetical protein PIROE2DRAFT_7157 [Piromyces sp. E2]|eukprot:OUM65743.1 hypothetical protein PIROE2DRAFT_7157 [Piromyces sp. E2]
MYFYKSISSNNTDILIDTLYETLYDNIDYNYQCILDSPKFIDRWNKNEFNCNDESSNACINACNNYKSSHENSTLEKRSLMDCITGKNVKKWGCCSYDCNEECWPARDACFKARYYFSKNAPPVDNCKPIC